MESLDDIIIKRDSWTSMLELLKPYIAPQNWHMIGPAKEQWNAIPLQRQRQIWVLHDEVLQNGLCQVLRPLRSLHPQSRPSVPTKRC